MCFEKYVAHCMQERHRPTVAHLELIQIEPKKVTRTSVPASSGLFRLRSVPVLSDVVTFLGSIVVLSQHGKFLGSATIAFGGRYEKQIHFAGQIKLRPFVLLELICNLLR